MSHGLQIINALDIVQIDEVYRNFHYAATTTTGQTWYGWKCLGINFTGWLIPFSISESPIVMMKPAVTGVNGAVGGVFMIDLTGTSAFPYGPALEVVARTAAPVALFSNAATPLSPFGGDFGLQVRAATGAIAFDSLRRYPPVTHVFTKQPGVSFPITFNFSGYSSMPWIVVNNLTRFVEYSEESADEMFIVASVNAALNQLTLSVRRDYNFQEVTSYGVSSMITVALSNFPG